MGVVVYANESHRLPHAPSVVPGVFDSSSATGNSRRVARCALRETERGRLRVGGDLHAPAILERPWGTGGFAARRCHRDSKTSFFTKRPRHLSLPHPTLSHTSA